MRNTPISLRPEQKEQAQHGETIFPVQRYTTLLSCEHPSVFAHWHEEAEFTLVTEGTCTYQVQLQTFTAHTDDLIFIPPMQLHSITAQTEQTLSDTYVFHMNYLGAGTGDICAMRYLSPLINQTALPPCHIQKTHPAYEGAFRLFCEMQSVWEQKSTGYELLVKSCLLSLIALLFPYCTENSALSDTESAHMQKVKTALEYISEHYTEPVTIAEIASACYFSEYHFMRLFKRYVGMSCTDYIKSLKLQKAAELFENGEQSILDVSLRVGFHNLSYFYREFRKKYGMTPKQFLAKTAVR